MTFRHADRAVTAAARYLCSRLDQRLPLLDMSQGANRVLWLLQTPPVSNAGRRQPEAATERQECLAKKTYGNYYYFKFRHGVLLQALAAWTGPTASGSWSIPEAAVKDLLHLVLLQA